VIEFKRDAYLKVVETFAPLALECVARG
jgi:hypothetical protein